MYYKEKQDSLPDKEGNLLWRPAVVRTGKMVDTRELSKLISTASTLTESDIYATLLILPQFMNIHLKEGHTIRLNGLGTFTMYGRSKGNGVLNKEDVRASQFNSLICKFTPEYTVSAGGNRTRVLMDNIQFTHINRLIGGVNTTGNGGNSGGDDDDDGWEDPNA